MSNHTQLQKRISLTKTTAGPGRLQLVPHAHMRAVKIRAKKWESDTQVLLIRFSTLLHANFVP